jgi:hypothetical protein
VFRRPQAEISYNRSTVLAEIFLCFPEDLKEISMMSKLGENVLCPWFDDDKYWTMGVRFVIYLQQEIINTHITYEMLFVNQQWSQWSLTAGPRFTSLFFFLTNLKRVDLYLSNESFTKSKWSSTNNSARFVEQEIYVGGKYTCIPRVLQCFPHLKLKNDTIWSLDSMTQASLCLSPLAPRTCPPPLIV